MKKFPEILYAKYDECADGSMDLISAETKEYHAVVGEKILIAEYELKGIKHLTTKVEAKEAM